MYPDAGQNRGEQAICKEFEDDQNIIKVATQGVSIAIIAFNYILREVGIKLIGMLQLPNEGK
jgi:hypothetical protein